MKRLLVFGISGFVGRTLARAAAEQSGRLGLELVGPPGHVELTDPRAVEECVAGVRPDSVVHLAAQTFVPESFAHPEDTFKVNLFGTLNVLKALKATGFRGRMIYVSSGDIYGLVPAAELPVTEGVLPKPRNPYSVSKVAAEALCYQWSQTEGVDVVVARPFNHIGPGQSERFVVSDFAKQIIEIKLRRREPRIAVGDIDVTRDFTDVRDVVRAYFSLLEKGACGEVYNICSGRERTVRSLLDTMLELAGVDAAIESDPSRMRRQEQRRMVGSFDKLQAATGWLPEYPIERSLHDILNHWEEVLRNA